MRGSIYHQNSVLTKLIFREKTKKEEKVNIKSDYYNYVSSYKTMESYKAVWNNFSKYLLEEFEIKNIELITCDHIEAYLDKKVNDCLSKKYIKKICSALMKLEFALNLYSKKVHENTAKKCFTYDFKETIDNCKKRYKNENLLADNYHDRTYSNADSLIKNLIDEKHQIAAKIQFFGGSRSEGVTLIKKEQLEGYSFDKIRNFEVGVLQTREKGGKIGDVYVDIDTYKKLIEIIEEEGHFKISYQKYLNDLKQAAKITNQDYYGSHGLRWTFARDRIRAYQSKNYSFEAALQEVSIEMKHFRAEISLHYIP